MKNKTNAGILALLLGSFGAHKFYLGQSGKGFLYLCFIWTLIPTIVSIIEGIKYLTMSEFDFDDKYNPQNMPIEKLQFSTEDLDDLKRKKVLNIKELDAILENDFRTGKIEENVYKVRKKLLLLESNQLNK